MIKNVLAQEMMISGTPITGPLVGYNTIGDVVNNVVPFVMSIAGIVLFFILMWGGYDYLMSQGAPEKVKSANAKITAGVIGFVLLVLSFLITRVITYVFGIGGGAI